MKRKKNRYPDIQNVFPVLSWLECKFCGNEFIMEKGFRISRPMYFSDWYCCNDCAKTKEEVDKKLKKLDETFLKSKSSFTRK